MADPGKPPSLYDELEDLETEISGYQAFLEEFQMDYDECGSGCTMARSGRRLDTDYLESFIGLSGSRTNL